MLAVQWRADLDRLDGIDTTIPRLSKEEMKCTIPWETPVSKYHGPKKPEMPLAAISHGEISAEMHEATRISLSRARDLDLNFLKDILFKVDYKSNIHSGRCLCTSVDSELANTRNNRNIHFRLQIVALQKFV